MREYEAEAARPPAAPKRCRICGAPKGLSGSDKTKCKPCRNLYLKEKRKDPLFVARMLANKRRYYAKSQSYRKYVRDYNLKRYGLSRDDAEAMLMAQHGRCGNRACGRELAFSGKVAMQRPYVDHDHKTGRVRGLLCINCNTALGHAKDNTSIIMGLAEYLHESLKLSSPEPLNDNASRAGCISAYP